MKALLGAFNQEKALVGTFSVIVKTDCGTDGSICGTICITHPTELLSARHGNLGWLLEGGDCQQLACGLDEEGLCD